LCVAQREPTAKLGAPGLCRQITDCWIAARLFGLPSFARFYVGSADQLTRGRRFRILTIVYDCTRESLALMADTSLSGVP
jgi:hypothetical protein